MTQGAVDSASRSALLVVDVQNDFCPGGALPVPDGDRVVAVLNRYIAAAEATGVAILASRDWHPRVTTHFADHGGPWPPHCVQGTDGARFRADLRLPPSAVVISKGEDPGEAGYSAFEGHAPDGRLLGDVLEARGITHLYVGGLATDYCVRQSVLDALAAGMTVTVLEDAVAGVDVQAGDSARAMAEMRAHGAGTVRGDGRLDG